MNAWKPWQKSQRRHTLSRREQRMHRDFKELLSILNAEDVRYLIVGGYAVSLLTYPYNAPDNRRSDPSDTIRV